MVLSVNDMPNCTSASFQKGLIAIKRCICEADDDLYKEQYDVAVGEDVH